jgi:hypothetical protein
MKLASLFLLALTLAGSSVQAAPTFSVHWSDCASTITNRGHADGSTAVVVVTVKGLSGVVRGTSAEVTIKHQGLRGLPQFWRFDEAGCQAGRFVASTNPGAGCSFLADPAATYSDFRIGEVAGGARFLMVFDPPAIDPNATYVIARFEFDFSNAECACSDQAQCLTGSASWIDGDGVEHDIFPEQQYVTWEDPYATTCGSGPLCGNPDDCVDPVNPCSGTSPTPAQSRSWGRLKASYR